MDREEEDTAREIVIEKEEETDISTSKRVSKIVEFPQEFNWRLE